MKHNNEHNALLHTGTQSTKNYYGTYYSTLQSTTAQHHFLKMLWLGMVQLLHITVLNNCNMLEDSRQR